MLFSRLLLVLILGLVFRSRVVDQFDLQVGSAGLELVGRVENLVKGVVDPRLGQAAGQPVVVEEVGRGLGGHGGTVAVVAGPESIQKNWEHNQELGKNRRVGAFKTFLLTWKKVVERGRPAAENKGKERGLPAAERGIRGLSSRRN